MASLFGRRKHREHMARIISIYTTAEQQQAPINVELKPARFGAERYAIVSPSGVDVGHGWSTLPLPEQMVVPVFTSFTCEMQLQYVAARYQSVNGAHTYVLLEEL